jgi:hypothetical protein
MIFGGGMVPGPLRCARTGLDQAGPDIKAHVPAFPAGSSTTPATSRHAPSLLNGSCSPSD